MNVEPTIGLALMAGFVSFISPCVLPLIPAYIGYMSGQATQAAGDEGSHKFGTFLHGIFFVLGFTIFFVGFGLLTSAAASTLDRLGIDIPTILTRLGGVAVILFGLYVMKVLDPVFARGLKFSQDLKTNSPAAMFFSLLMAILFLAYYFWVFENILLGAVALLLTLALFRNALQNADSIGDFWYRAIQSLQFTLISDTRNLEMEHKRTGYLGSTGMGIVFAAGWTPCIGPIYGSILTLAATSASDTGSLVSAGAMLTAYSLGLGIPFLVAALALNQMSGVMTKLKRNMRKVEYASGALLILIGVLILSGSLERITSDFRSGEMGELSYRLEGCTAGIGEGRIHMSSWVNCVTDGIDKLDNPVVFAALKPAQSAEASEPPLFVADPNFDESRLEVGLQPGMLAPNFQTTTLEGEPVSLEDYRGEIVLLNFWATWCTPCRAEMPDFQKVFEAYEQRGFVILGVNFLEEADQIRPFIQDEVGVNFPILLDYSGEINDLFKVRNYPSTYILDGNGVILGYHAGQLIGEQLIEFLEGLNG